MLKFIGLVWDKGKHKKYLSRGFQGGFPFCPYDFFNPLLIFNILTKNGVRFCPYDFCNKRPKNKANHFRSWPFSSFSLYLFSMHKAPDNHPDADEHKGDAEPLAHVEGHVTLKVDLDVLQELDTDARAENDNEEGAEHQAELLMAEVALVIHPQ